MTHTLRIGKHLSRSLSCALTCAVLIGSAVASHAQSTTIWGWGLNTSGQIGNNAITNVSSAVQVKGVGNAGFFTDARAIARGGGHSLALKGGEVYAWGLNRLGQCGDATTTNRRTPVQVKGPNGVGTLNNIVAIAAGGDFSLALKADGTVWGWGYNSDRELGDGTTTDRSTPVQVKGPNGQGFLTGIVSLDCGTYHTIALRGDGTLWAWGYGNLGRLGDGNLASHNAAYPIQVLGDGSDGYFADAVAVAVGANHSMALTKEGLAYAWGHNDNGQLGNGSYTQNAQPSPVTSPDGLDVLSNVTDISAGYIHSLAIRSDGTVVAWGYNGTGCLGDGTTTGRTLPVQVKGAGGVGFLTNVVAIAGGGREENGNYGYSVALKADGTVFAWGSNLLGQLGDTTNTNRTTPVQVKHLADPITFLTGIVSLGNGGGYNNHTHALKGTGTIQAQVQLDNTVCLGTPIHFEFRPVGGGTTVVRDLIAGPAGRFSFFDVPPGTYNVAVKGSKWLTQVVPNVNTTGGVNVLNLRVNLRGGDCVEDNEINFLDLGFLIGAYDTVLGDATYADQADINCDNRVDFVDLGILIGNYDQIGD